MTLLLTGASGFLGRNIIGRLSESYRVTTLARSAGNDIAVDLAAAPPLLPERYDVVVHAAGKAHEIPGKEESIEFHRVNVEGTKNLCLALEKTGLPKSFVFISTVSVYGEDEGENITEEHSLDGTSAYARSKIEAEAFLTDWCARNGVSLAILRPSLIVGPYATGNMAAMIKGIRRGIYADIAGGKALRSLVGAADMAEVILKATGKNGIYNVCERCHHSVAEIARHIADKTERRHLLSIPLWLARAAAVPGDILGQRWPLDSYRLSKLTESLTFDSAKACRELDWEPKDALTDLTLE